MDERKRDFSNGINSEINRKTDNRIAVAKLKTKRYDLEKAVEQLFIDFEQETALQVTEVSVVGRKNNGIVGASIEVMLPHGMSIGGEILKKKRPQLKPQSEWKNSMVPETEEEGG